MPRHDMTFDEIAGVVGSRGNAEPRTPLAINHERREAHCMVCHQQVEEGAYHPRCVGMNVRHCEPTCDPYWEEAYFGMRNTPPEERGTIRERIDRMIEDSPIPEYGRSLYDAMEESQRVVDIPESAFSDFSFATLRPGARRKAKKIEKPKTMEEELKEFLEQLKETPKEEIELRMKYYVEDRDEKLLRKILEETRGLRTYYDIRCFINDYIFRNK